MDTPKVYVLLLSLLSVQLFQVLAQSDCTQPTCPKQRCLGKYTSVVLPDGCIEIFCDDEVKSTSNCRVPRCPAACSASPSKQIGKIDKYDGCCKCLCKGGSTTCPTNCELGTKLITRNGRKKCVCETNTRCLPYLCPKNCPPGARKTVFKGKCKSCTCKVNTCTDDGSCNYCRHGRRYTYQNGCYKCACCMKAQCPKNCDHGTETLVEDGCKKCVCKCGPPICTSCPAPPPCKYPCRLVPEGMNGCDICKCPNTCTKKCAFYKHVNGKKVCECCPPASLCPITCNIIPGGDDGCGICKCPDCMQYKYDSNQRRTNQCCPPCKSPCRLEPGGNDGCGLCKCPCQKMCNKYKLIGGKTTCECCPPCKSQCRLEPGGNDGCGVCKCPCQKTCNKYKLIGGKTTCECCPTCKDSCKLIPGGSDGCGVCNCPPKCPPYIMQRCKPHCRQFINGCPACRCPDKKKGGKHKPGGHGRPKKHKPGGHGRPTKHPSHGPRRKHKRGHKRRPRH